MRADGKWWRRVVHKEGDDTKPIETNLYLDDSAPYAAEMPLPGGGTETWVYNGEKVGDSPGIPAEHDNSEVEFDITAQMYFTYKPAGAKSIWVTLGRVDWIASGQAVRSGVMLDAWQLKSSFRHTDALRPLRDLPEWEANSDIYEWIKE